MNEAGPISYIDTDLQLFARFDLEPFGDNLSTYGICPISKGRFDDGAWWKLPDNTYWLNLELALKRSRWKHRNPERTILRLLEIIEALSPDLTHIWTRCLRRTFDVGYQGGPEPPLVHERISTKTLARMAALRVDLEISLYPENLPSFDLDGCRITEAD